MTAAYERLSRDDDREGESMSIENQKQILEEYATKNGFSNIVHFSDDGYSGGSFDRPSWKRLIGEIENGNVSTIIVKDMSRVGRDYLQVGFYTEVMFREKNIRFVAISNNIDSQNSESGEFAPFLNIMSEWYLRDSSRKVKTVMKSKGMSGQRLTFNPIYGYRLDPNDKTKWIIDEESAEVVRRIYQLTIEGKGPCEIARIFANEKIERPSYYQTEKGIVNRTQYDTSIPYAWSGNSIARMIGKYEYAGHTVNFRTYKDSYKDKRAKENPKEDWVIFENTHPEIVDSETWETAQRCRKTVRRIDKLGEANPLTGLVYCADCGAKMYNHRKPSPTTYINDKGYTCTRSPKDVYQGSTYNLTGRQYNQQCSSHNIQTSALREIALAAIQTMSGFVKSNEAEFIKQVRENSNLKQAETAKAYKKRIIKEGKRISELNVLIKKLYEDNALNRINDKRFEILSADYEHEQENLEQSIKQLQSELDTFENDSVRADKFIDIVKRYIDFTELTTPMINEFIEKIVVCKADDSNGERMQKVDVYLNFIGKFEIPIPDPTPEEIAEENRQREKRAKHREAQRRYVEKQKQNQ